MFTNNVKKIKGAAQKTVTLLSLFGCQVSHFPFKTIFMDNESVTIRVRLYWWKSEKGRRFQMDSYRINVDDYIAQRQRSKKTRMHSSIMRTGPSLTICRSLLPGEGGCLLLGAVCLLPRGVSASGGCVCSGGGGLLLGGGLLWGVSALGGVHSGGGVGIPACTEADTPPVNRMTDRCKNITLATPLRPVNIRVRFRSV